MQTFCHDHSTPFLEVNDIIEKEALELISYEYLVRIGAYILIGLFNLVLY